MNRAELDEISWSMHPKIKSAKRNKAETAYIDSVVRFAGRKTGKTHKTILDVPCGTGRLHAYLRKYGYNVSGIDANEAFIISARNKYRRHMADYHTADMKSFRLNKNSMWFCAGSLVSVIWVDRAIFSPSSRSHAT